MYKYFCLLFPSPAPNNPPDPIAYKLWIICHPESVASAQGSKKLNILVYLNPPFLTIYNTPATITGTPSFIK